MRALRQSVFAILVVSIGCTDDGAFVPGSSREVNSAREAVSGERELAEADDDMLEAVFRYQFDHHPYNVKAPPPAYYVDILENDPSQDFLDRFTDLPTPVKALSDYDCGTTVPGRYWIKSVEWIDRRNVRVTTYYSDGTFPSGNTVVLANTGNEWSVTELETYFVE